MSNCRFNLPICLCCTGLASVITLPLSLTDSIKSVSVWNDSKSVVATTISSPACSKKRENHTCSVQHVAENVKAHICYCERNWKMKINWVVYCIEGYHRNFSGNLFTMYKRIDPKNTTSGLKKQIQYHTIQSVSSSRVRTSPPASTVAFSLVQYTSLGVPCRSSCPNTPKSENN